MVLLHISETVHHMIVVFDAHLYNDDIFSNIVIFQNYDFSGFYSVKGQKMTQNYQFQSVLLFIAGTVDHIEIFGTSL